ncbi:hypothetical protein GVAV_000351 [Gurleya vavrai]
MENSTTRKRIVESIIEERLEKYKIYEQVFLLASLRSNIPRICDALSVSLRVAILADLSFSKAIELNKNKIKTNELIINDNILDEVFSLIRNTAYEPSELLFALNGESYSKGKYQLHVKKLRDKISKKLESRGLIRYGNKKYKFFKGKPYLDERVKRELMDDIYEYLENKEYNLRSEVIICCLNYCGVMEDLFFSLEPKKVILMKEKMKMIKKKYINIVIRNEEPEKSITPLLHTLYNMHNKYTL